MYLPPEPPVPPKPLFDLVTVFHNEHNHIQAKQLASDVEYWAEHPYTFTAVDNTIDNRGFAKACNLGAAQGEARVIGFLNPDVEVQGPFTEQVLAVFNKSHLIAITGEKFNKPKRELATWGLTDWVCGAAFFVRRAWWNKVGGFDEEYVWSWEETDLIRRAIDDGQLVQSTFLPFAHESPAEESTSLEDSVYKAHYFEVGRRRFREKWNQPNA